MAGNKTKLTKDFIEQADKLKRKGTSNADICRALGIREQTLYNWLKDGGNTPNQKELFECLKKAEAEYKVSLREKIEKAGKKDWKALAWLLERLYPQEYGRVDRLQAEVQQSTTASVKVEHYFDYGEGETSND